MKLLLPLLAFVFLAPAAQANSYKGRWKSFMHELRVLEKLTDKLEDQAEEGAAGGVADQLHETVKMLRWSIEDSDGADPYHITIYLDNIHRETRDLATLLGATDREKGMESMFNAVAKQVEVVDGAYRNLFSLGRREQERVKP